MASAPAIIWRNQRGISPCMTGAKETTMTRFWKFVLQVVVNSAFACLLFSSLASLGKAWGLPASEEARPVCEIISNAKDYDGRSVVIEATVIADMHGTVLEGSECHKGIYLAFASGHPGEKWKALEDAVAAKGSGLDKRVLRVKVRGIYHHALLDGNRHIRQLEATEVLFVSFEGPKKATSDGPGGWPRFPR